jgi:hypothetical protein
MPARRAGSRQPALAKAVLNSLPAQIASQIAAIRGPAIVTEGF